MKNQIVFFFVLLLGLTATTAEAKNYYVSASGNNANDGLTAATAWQTISKVNSSFSNILPGDSILFRRGDVFYGALVVGKSGSSGKPIVFSAYGTGAKPVITGFTTLSSWTSVGNGVYQAVAPGKATMNMVTLNNVPQALGRYPNATDSNGGYLKYESFSGTTSITDNELTSATNWTGADVVIRKKFWVLDRNKITAHNGTTLTYDNGGSTDNGSNNFGYFITNDPRTLDQLGEWYFNSSTKMVQMYFGAASPSSCTVKASTIDTLFSVVAMNYININNIAFDGPNGWGIYTLNASNVNIQDCDVTNGGQIGIIANNGSNILVENCTVSNILNNGITVNNASLTNSTVRNCAVKNIGLLPGMGQNGSMSYKAIIGKVSNGLVIEYNKVDSVGYCAIDFQGNNVQVNNNVVNYFCVLKDDGGGIYTWSGSTEAVPGTIYTGRVVHDNVVMNAIGAPIGRFGAPGSEDVCGIDLDGRSLNIDVLNNTVFNSNQEGVHTNSPYYVNIRGNTFYNNKGNNISMTRYANIGQIVGLKVKNNICYSTDETQGNFYYSNTGINEPTPMTFQSAMQNLGDIDSNYYNRMNVTCFSFDISATTGGASIPESKQSLGGWQSFSGHDIASKRPAKEPVAYKLSGLTSSNKFSNGTFTSNITGVTTFGSNVTGVWDNTNKISGGSYKMSFSSPTPNRVGMIHSPMGAISSTKNYILRFSTYGTTAMGIVNAYIRKTASPYNNLIPSQTHSFGVGRTDHEFLFAAPTTDAAGGSFVIEVDQNSGDTYIDNIEFYEANATVMDVASQVRFEYNATNAAKTVALDANYTAVDGTVYNGTLTLQPYTSKVMVKNIDAPALKATATAAAINCYGGTSNVTVTATGGTAPYTGTGSFTVKAGTYNYTVTDAMGITDTASITITQPTALNDSASAPAITVAGGTTTVTVTATGGTAPYTGTGTFSGVAAGSYNYVVTDAKGCSATTAITITQPAATFNLTTISTPASGGSISTNPNTATYTSGTVVTLTANPAVGYTFTGWSGDATGTATSVTVTMNANKNVTANFQAIPVTYTLTTISTPVAGGSVSTSPNTANYASGTVVTLTATPAAGYTFTGWSGDTTGTATSVSVTMSANKNVTANFQAIPVNYTLTTASTPVSGGSVSTNPNTKTYTSGTVVTLTATPASGYTFTGWSGDATGTAASVTVTMSADKTVTANFQAISATYTLTTASTPVSGGSVSTNPNTATCTAGTVVTLTAKPAAGYIFKSWSGDATGTSASTTVTMNANKTVTANFEAAYTISLIMNPTVGGSVTKSINAATYSPGTKLTITAVPAPGYVFSNWNGDATGTMINFPVTMNKNKIIKATFKPVYTLTIASTPVAGGSVSRNPNTATYVSGTVVTLTATPAAGYTFTGWSGGATGTAASVSVTMSANKNVTANFKATLLARSAPTATTATTATIATTQGKTGVYPNPAGSSTNIGFNLPESQKVAITIVGESGNKVAGIASKLYPAGYNVQVLNVSGIPPGVYIVLVTGERIEQQAYKLVIVH